MRLKPDNMVFTFNVFICEPVCISYERLRSLKRMKRRYYANNKIRQDSKKDVIFLPYSLYLSDFKQAIQCSNTLEQIILSNTKIRYSVHKIPPLDSVLSEFHAVYIVKTIYLLSTLTSKDNAIGTIILCSHSFSN